MRVYWELAKAGFRRYSRYRAALLSSLVTNTIFGLVRASMLLTAIATAGAPVAGYDARQAATYVWLGQALLGPIDVWGSTVEVGDRIKSGDIAVDLSRPLSLLGSALATNYGRAAFELIPRALPILALGFFLTGLELPRNPLAYLLGAALLVGAMALTYTFYFAVQLSSLWVIENRGFLTIAMAIQQILSGFVVPVAWFPGWLQTLAHASPFPAMFQSTLDAFGGRLTTVEALQSLAIQGAWLTATILLALTILALGRRKVVVQGG